MKVVFVFAFVVAGITALPQPDEYPIESAERGVVINIAINKAIKAASQAIRDAGLDPLYIDRKEFSYALPVPVLFNADGYAVDVMSSGLSNIVVHKMSYTVVKSRLTFDIELPLINFSVGDSAVEATFFGSKFEAKASGKVDIRGIRIAGQVRVNVGIRGVSVRSVSITFNLGGITADVNVVIQGKDSSEKINTFLNTTVPKTLADHSDEINELLEILLMDLINSNLKK